MKKKFVWHASLSSDKRSIYRPFKTTTKTIVKGKLRDKPSAMAAYPIFNTTA